MLISIDRQATQLGGQVIGGDMARNFAGVMVDRTGLSAVSIANASSAILDWVAGGYDIGGWFNPGSPTILTVPPGVTRVRVWFNVGFSGDFILGDTVSVRLFVNGALAAVPSEIRYVPVAGMLPIWMSSSPSFAVVPGDTLSVQFTVIKITGGTMLVSVDGSSVTAFDVEAVTVEF